MSDPFLKCRLFPQYRVLPTSFLITPFPRKKAMMLPNASVKTKGGKKQKFLPSFPRPLRCLAQPRGEAARPYASASRPRFSGFGKAGAT